MNPSSALFQEVSPETVKAVFSASLGVDQIHSARLMEGGLFNTTYLVSFGPEGKQAILRLGPVNRHLLMGFEGNLMNAEAVFYALCRQNEIPCSAVLALDTSRTVIDRDYMIVDYIPSQPMSRAGLTGPHRQRLYTQLGGYVKKLHGITGDRFGFLSRIAAGMGFDSWSEALLFETEDIARRLSAAGGLTAGEVRDLLRQFRAGREDLDQIRTPRLVHTDLWEGNVLLDPQCRDIAAIIDGDRAVFGDPDFEFSSPWMERDLLSRGYGPILPEPLSPARARRLQLYRMFYCLLEAYVWHSEYRNTELYEERKSQLLELMGK